MSRGAVGRLVVAGAGLLLLAACGERPGYDATVVETYLQESQGSTFGAEETVESVSCPDDLTLLEGMTFTCEVVVAGGEVPFEVTLRDVGAEQVRVSARPAGVLISARRLGDEVRSSLPRPLAAAEVDCGGTYVVVEVGEALDCRMMLGSQEKPLTVTVRDTEGHVQIGS